MSNLPPLEHPLWTAAGTERPPRSLRMKSGVARALPLHSKALRALSIPALCLGSALAEPWISAVAPEQLSFEGTQATPQSKDNLLSIKTIDRNPFPSVLIHAPNGHWDLSKKRYIETTFENTGKTALNMAFWAVGAPGWDAPVGTVKLEPGRSKSCSIDLAQRWSGGLVNKVDASHIKYLRVSLTRPNNGGQFNMGPVFLKGASTPSPPPPDYQRLSVPEMEQGLPTPGKRVRHQLPEFKETEIYHSLYLPVDWKPGRTFPVIVEYTGNRWLNPPCHSVGRPESGRMGYGMSEGKGYIWVNAPYVNYKTGTQALNGWGNADDTADYAIKLVKHICATYGGDPDNVIITGFSRGAVACGYIGLRNDAIAKLWKAFHPCQHYDGDGVHGATYESALNERMPRIHGRRTFHTDNGKHEKLRQLFKRTGDPVVYASSGIGAHTDTMFLENRPSTLQLRKWLAETVDEGKK